MPITTSRLCGLTVCFMLSSVVAGLAGAARAHTAPACLLRHHATILSGCAWTAACSHCSLQTQQHICIMLTVQIDYFAPDTTATSSFTFTASAFLKCVGPYHLPAAPISTRPIDLAPSTMNAESSMQLMDQGVYTGCSLRAADCMATLTAHFARAYFTVSPSLRRHDRQGRTRSRVQSHGCCGACHRHQGI